MSRTATKKLDSKTVRLRFDARIKHPYYKTLSNGITLGYDKTPGVDATWCVRKRLVIGNIKKYVKATIGIADDGTKKPSLTDITPTINGAVDNVALLKVTRHLVLSHTQAAEVARAWAKIQMVPTAENESFTVQAAIDQYLKLRALKVGAEGASNVTKQKSVLKKHVSDDLQSTRLADLTDTQLLEWRGSLPGSIGNVNSIVVYLRAALNAALKAKHVKIRTWDVLKPLAEQDEVEATGIYLTPEQITKLIQSAPNQPTRDLLHAAALSGFRIGELKRLKVADFRPREGYIAIPKDKTKARKVALWPDLSDLFERLCDGRGRDEFIFTTVTGVQWKDHSLNVREAVTAAGMQDVTVYDLRHSWITAALQSGLDLLTLTKTAGTSVEMIKKYYFHLLHDKTRDLLSVHAPKISV
jgi:integrase